MRCGQWVRAHSAGVQAGRAASVMVRDLNPSSLVVRLLSWSGTKSGHVSGPTHRGECSALHVARSAVDDTLRLAGASQVSVSSRAWPDDRHAFLLPLTSPLRTYRIENHFRAPH